MIHTIYIEEGASDYPKTREILKRFPSARQIPIDHYGEVFNTKAQNFRLQKQNPALIIAVKKGGYALPAPQHYNIGGSHNFYFSHMMNCVYDCRYCFLQGMYQSANYVIFVNYDDFFTAIRNEQNKLEDESGWFFSGYDCDSLALEPVTQFIDAALDLFQDMPNSWLEIRTKSTQIRPLLKRNTLKNCIVAFSLSPEDIVEALEHKTASLEKRLTAAATLAERGWPIGFRFDPVIATENFNENYSKLFKRVFSTLPETSLHSISLGPFRLPKPFHKKLIQLYPEEPMFAADMRVQGNLASYSETSESEMLGYCKEQILEYIPEDKFFPCVDIN